MKMGEITIRCGECGLPMNDHPCPAEVMLRLQSERSAGSESRSSEWVEELEAALRHAKKAVDKMHESNSALNLVLYCVDVIEQAIPPDPSRSSTDPS